MNISDIKSRMAKAIDNNVNRELHMFAIKDEKTGEYNAPFFQPAAPAALRLFGMEVNRPDSQNLAYHHPEDFALYYLGTFNAGSGEIKATHELIARGDQVKRT